MGTFISSLIIYGFAASVLGLVGKLIYDIQQTKKENKESDNEFEAKDKFQTLAGIKPHNPSNKTNELVSAMLNAEKLKEEFKDVQFPAPDPSIPVTTAKLTTIGGSYGDSDPLAQVPMSRVSKKAKQKMAEIAKQDISEQLEQKTKKKNPKQDIKVVDDGKPFVKTRKKSTKNKKENE
jgi:hypothetical protein